LIDLLEIRSHLVATLRFDFDSTAIRPLCDHSTLRHVPVLGCCTAA